MAVSKSTLPKGDARAVIAAAYGADAPQEELQAVISQIAINIHGAYVLKLSTDHPQEYNAFRFFSSSLFLYIALILNSTFVLFFFLV